MIDNVTPSDGITHHLSKMYQNWFLDYASYVILERAVPHIADGFKPVQRRIMHTMKRLDDGKYNKVANIVGDTMKFHPHGDASIKHALVQLGQKDLLIDCQGNWGNIITGDDAAAGRYIEARLSKFALDVVFNPKTTEWKWSYDGRNKEPVALPVKFPLLLAQGAEGIAVGMNCKILPHNLVEICDAAISYLHGEEFHLYPDFPTGGSIDVSKYNDGQRGGSVRVRAKIEKRDNKTLAITEIPYGKTTGTASNPSTFINSILKANERGKIKIRNVEDLTAASAEILIHLTPGTTSDLNKIYMYDATNTFTEKTFDPREGAGYAGIRARLNALANKFIYTSQINTIQTKENANLKVTIRQALDEMKEILPVTHTSGQRVENGKLVSQVSETAEKMLNDNRIVRYYLRKDAMK